MSKARFVAIAVLACCLPAYGAMGPLADTSQGADAVSGVPPAPVSAPQGKLYYGFEETVDYCAPPAEGGLRDTHAGDTCVPAIGLAEPVPCTTNGDCVGLGKAGQQPNTCGTNGFCEYPAPTPCPNGNEDCWIPDVNGVYIGTGLCVFYDEASGVQTGTPCTTNGDCIPPEECGTNGCGGGGWFCEDQNFHAPRDPSHSQEGEWTVDGSQGHPEGGCGVGADEFNTGCNSQIYPEAGVFSPISCGETILGTAAMFSYGGSIRRDTDWYEIHITEPTLFTAHATCEFDFYAGWTRNHGDTDCRNLEGLWQAQLMGDEACVKKTLKTCIRPGTWWFWIGIDNNTQAECPCLDYELTLECEAPCHIACCIGNDVCVQTDHETCEFILEGGAKDGDCYPGLCAFDCPGQPLNCNGYYEVDNSVNQDGMNPQPSCGTGQNIGTLWFNFVATAESVQVSTCNSVGVASDSVFALYSGDCYNTLVEIGCAEDPQNCEDPGSWLGQLDVDGIIVGDTYYIQLGSWSIDVQGVHDLDITCPSPLYKAAACCLSDGSCITATPSECAAEPPNGGQYQGPESYCMGDGDTNGIDDACEIGACCVPDVGCEPGTHDYCLGPQGGVEFIPGASCPDEPGDYDPCFGACCVWKPTPPPPGAGYWDCSEGPNAICPGDWYPMEGCGGPGGDPPWFDCPDDRVCTLHPEQDSNCQSPWTEIDPITFQTFVDGSLGTLSDEDPWLAGGDEEVLAQRGADDFIPLASGIDMVCWWGFYLDQDRFATPPPAGTAPECDIPDDDFTITYYLDNNGCPGAVHAQFSEKDEPPTLTVTKTTLGNRTKVFVGIYPDDLEGDCLVYEYEGTHEPLAVTPGECYWLEIMNDTGPSSCSWAWSPSEFDEGNGYSVDEYGVAGSTLEWDCDPYDPNATVMRRHDLAWCLNVANTPCDFCRELAEGDPEGEPVCYDEYIDTYNYGCNICPALTTCTTDMWTIIECGQVIRGTAGTYMGHPQCQTGPHDEDCLPGEDCIDGVCVGGEPRAMRDTDWFKFVLTEQTDMRWCVYAPFPTLTGTRTTGGLDQCTAGQGWGSLAVKASCVDYCAEETLAAGTWYGYVATTATGDGADCGSEYEVCLDCGQGCVQSCEAVDARSVKDHSGTEFKLDMGVSGGIESRTTQVTKLEIDLDSSASVSVDDTASVTCSTAWSGSATVTDVSTNGVTVTVEFSPALPNKAYCVITLDCMTRLSEVCVRNIEGDMNGDGTCNTSDASQVKLRFGQTVTDANCRWDFNRDGVINTTDASNVKLRFGFTAPACP